MILMSYWKSLTNLSPSYRGGTDEISDDFKPRTSTISIKMEGSAILKKGLVGELEEDKYDDLQIEGMWVL